VLGGLNSGRTPTLGCFPSPLPILHVQVNRMMYNAIVLGNETLTQAFASQLLACNVTFTISGADWIKGC
jgi:hypothetical protein